MKSRSNISSLRFFTKMHPDEKSVHAKDVVEMCLFKKKKEKTKIFQTSSRCSCLFVIVFIYFSCLFVIVSRLIGM